MAEPFVEDGFGVRFAGRVKGWSDGGDDAIWVDQVYGLEPHVEEDGGTHSDPGFVGLNVTDPEGHEAQILLDTGEALHLAFLLNRVVGWCFDEVSDNPDVEREAARFAAK
jgi:hypothetical protein